DTGHSDELAQWAHGCDLLLMECSLPDDQGIEIHMTPGLAAEFARMAEVDQVVLTHFYPSVINENLVDIVSASFSGPVTVARDGERFTL
ncbi:MAG: MBL fold metallo-hydrolase, partial [Gemmatimonadota bacterium]|nr:MBL fold metallo-hydrolase [Gemmatimonadota bacterium]